jgi:tetratricopeptide (TPR) repeat protein
MFRLDYHRSLTALIHPPEPFTVTSILFGLLLTAMFAAPSPASAQSPAAPAASVPGAQSPAVVPVAPAATVLTAAPTQEELGDSLALHQRYQAAIAAYSKAKPSAAVWNKMGIAYQMMFNLTDATRCYKESLKIESRNSQVLNNLATIYDSLKNFAAAERLYRKSLKFQPQSALVLKNLGTNLMAQRKYNRGWDVYKQALAIDPQIFEDRNAPRVQNPASVQERGAMNYYMALGCVRAGQIDCALQYLRMALDEGFTNPKKVATDVAFASLRENPDFKQLLASQSASKAPVAR